MFIISFKILAIIVPEKTLTQKKLTELRSYAITELRTDQIQYSPTFSKRGHNNMVFDSSKTRGDQVDSSVVVHELELAINRALYGFCAV